MKRQRTHIDHPQVTSTPFPEPDRRGESDMRNAYTRGYPVITNSARRPLFIFRVRMQDRPA